MFNFIINSLIGFLKDKRMFVGLSIVGNTVQGFSSVILDISVITITTTVFPGHTTILVSGHYFIHILTFHYWKAHCVLISF